LTPGNNVLVKVDFIRPHVQLNFVGRGVQVEFDCRGMETIPHGIIIFDGGAGQIEHNQFDFAHG
jgi:hypothetical protein